MPPRLRAALGSAALLVASLGLVLGGLELGLRLCWGGYYAKFRTDRPEEGVRFHPERGWALVPGARVTRGEAEYTYHARHNARGMRGPDVGERPAQGRVRLLVLGDSMTYGYGVEDDETFCAVLERLAPQLEVIDAGVGNYSGVQELLLLREEGRALHPDVVLVAFFWNDVADAYDSRYARFTLEGGALRFHPPDPATPEHPAFASRRRRSAARAARYESPLARSYSWRFLSDRFALVRMMIAERFRGGIDAGHAADDERRERAWALSLALLSEMRRTSSAMGARFAITVVPDQAEIEPDVKLLGATPVLFEARARVAAFAAREGIPFIDLHPAVAQARARSDAPFFYRFDRHWNARGHAAAAAALRDGLARLGWIAAPAPAAARVPGPSAAGADAATAPAR